VVPTDLLRNWNRGGGCCSSPCGRTSRLRVFCRGGWSDYLLVSNQHFVMKEMGRSPKMRHSSNGMQPASSSLQWEHYHKFLASNGSTNASSSLQWEHYGPSHAWEPRKKWCPQALEGGFYTYRRGRCHPRDGPPVSGSPWYSNGRLKGAWMDRR